MKFQGRWGWGYRGGKFCGCGSLCWLFSAKAGWEGKDKIIIVSLEEIGFVVVKWFAEGNFVEPAWLTLNSSYHSHVTLKEFVLVKTEVFVDMTINSSMVFRYLARKGSLFIFWSGKTKKNSFKWGKWQRVFNVVQIKYYNVVTTFCRQEVLLRLFDCIKTQPLWVISQ